MQVVRECGGTELGLRQKEEKVDSETRRQISSSGWD